MPDPFGYDGEWQDAATGLVDLRARWYDPTAGQLLSRDPLHEQTGQPYAYADDNPLNGSDALGLQGCQGASGPQWSWQRLGSAIGDTFCNIGEAKDTLLHGAGALVAPPCDVLHGGCRLPTGQEVVTQAGRWTAAGSAVGTVAHDVGTALRPNCWPGFQSCRWETPQEAQQTVYGMAVGAYGALNTLTFGAEGAVGRWAGLRDVSCLPEYQQGARLGVVAAFFLPGGEEAALAEETRYIFEPTEVLFGQRRIGPFFRISSDAPDYIRGRSILDVATDLRSGKLAPQDIIIQAFEHEGQLVAINNRGLAALSLAGLRPTLIEVVQPTGSILARLAEEPIISGAPLPGPRIPITAGPNDLTVLRIVEIP